MHLYVIRRLETPSSEVAVATPSKALGWLGRLQQTCATAFA